MSTQSQSVGHHTSWDWCHSGHFTPVHFWKERIGGNATVLWTECYEHFKDHCYLQLCLALFLRITLGQYWLLIFRRWPQSHINQSNRRLSAQAKLTWALSTRQDELYILKLLSVLQCKDSVLLEEVCQASSPQASRFLALTLGCVAGVEHSGQTEAQGVISLHGQLWDVDQSDGSALSWRQAAHVQLEHVWALITLLQQESLMAWAQRIIILLPCLNQGEV